MHLLVFINLVFAVTTFSLLYFTGKKIQEYVLMVYSYAPALQELESVLSEDTGLADMNVLNEAVAVINQSYKMILIVTIISIVSFFIIWCFFQSLEWRITYNSLKKRINTEELFDKSYRKYALRFALVTIPAFMILFPAFYYFVAQVKALFLNMIISMYNLSEVPGEMSYPLIAALFFVIFFVSYFTVMVYILLNRYKVFDAVKKSFSIGIKKMYMFAPIHLVCLMTIALVLYFDSFFAKFLDFKIAAILSLIVYFVLLSCYQVLMASLLEKE